VLVPLIRDAADRFQKTHPNAKFDVRPGGSAKGIADARSGAAEVGMVSRPLRQNERELYSFAVARDAIAVVVHRDNPLKRITTSELRDILTGQTTNWKAFGGRDSAIRPGWATQGGGAAELLLDHLKFRRDQIGPHTSVANGAEAVRFVASDPSGIAVASVADAERAIKGGAPLKLVTFNGVMPSSRTVQNHTYALSRPLLLVTRDMPTGLRKQFIDYAVSDQIVDLQVKYGFVPYRE